ncbi:2'-5' RNA ligase [Cnuella takakiae]|uniref:2'-5' RNA ligase n=2 Tax=Cnuella takakiae TaxID=1302690 RepID=A0A1M5J8A0_9BACT|nr:2'-5' RNA ligase [Cnuella takakiae]
MYYIAHVLPPELDTPIQRIKEDLHQRFGCAVGLKSPAHITLLPPFWLAPDKEPLLRSDLKQLAARIAPFPLHTKGFDSFGKRTFFVALEDSAALQQLKVQADDLFTGNPAFGLKKEVRPFHPHVTLATRDIKPSDFVAAWNLYQDQQLVDTWQANTVSLLRHNGRKWDVVATEGFGGS